MKHTLLICSIWAFSFFAQAQVAGLHTSGNALLGVCGDTVVLHGINYAPYSWGYDSTQLFLGEVAQTGANVVRMTWYANTTAPYYTDDLLDSAIGKAISNKMIPIIELHDNTCLNDYDSLVSLAQWYVQPSRLAIILKYSSSLIINVANEAGYVDWTGDTLQSAERYENAYDSIARLFRKNGINVPLLLDAPDCGTSIDAFTRVASNIISNDPIHNVIFSAHAYWYSYADNDSAIMYQLISAAVNQHFPLVIGEMADYQDGDTACQYRLNYQALLHICRQLNIGWLAWSWVNDACTMRQLSVDGSYANLTAYGNDFVNNPIYGLRKVSTLTEYLANNQTPCATSGISNFSNTPPFLIFNQDGRAFIRSLSNQTLKLQAYNIIGQSIMSTQLQPGQTLQLYPASLGIVSVNCNGQNYAAKYISLQ